MDKNNKNSFLLFFKTCITHHLEKYRAGSFCLSLFNALTSLLCPYMKSHSPFFWLLFIELYWLLFFYLGDGHGDVVELSSASLRNGPCKEEPQTVFGKKRFFILEKQTGVCHKKKPKVMNNLWKLSFSDKRQRWRFPPVCATILHFHPHVSEKKETKFRFPYCQGSSKDFKDPSLETIKVPVVHQLLLRLYRGFITDGEGTTSGWMDEQMDDQSQGPDVAPRPSSPLLPHPPAHCKLCETLSFTLCSHLGADSGCCFTQCEDGDVLSSVQPVDGQFGAGGPFHHGHVVLTTKHKGGGGVSSRSFTVPKSDTVCHCVVLINRTEHVVQVTLIGHF